MRKIGVITPEFIERKPELIEKARLMLGDEVVADYAQRDQLTILALKVALQSGEKLPQSM